MKIYRRLATAFAAEGVTNVFGLMGDGNMFWMQQLDKLGVKLHEVRHEGVAMGMADGWARATNSVGVCTTTCGPGVSQLATALITASRAESPVVAFVGEFPTRDQDYGQRLDQSRFAEACEAGFVRVVSEGNADDAVRQAFYRAKSESRPIMLSAPIDTQERPFDDDEPYRPSTTLFPRWVAQPSTEGLKQAVDIIANSRKPVIVVGRGAIRGGAGDAVVKLGNRIGALIATSLLAKGWLNDTTEYHVGISGSYGTRTSIELASEADCVIAIGASMNRYTLMGNLLYPNARYVHIDSKPQVVMGGNRAADCYIQSDARVATEALEKLLAERSVQLTGYRTPEVKKRLLHHFEDRAEFLVEPGTVDAREVCLTLDQTLPGDVALVVGTGASSGFTTMLFNRPRPWMLTGKFFGCIGQGFPAAMGAVLAKGNKPAILVDGDASFMMHFSDFDTAVRYNIPLLCVILNDQALGSEYQKFQAHDMSPELSVIPTPDMGAIAKGYGGKGVLAKTVEEVRAAAAEWVAKPCPMVIDVRISRNVLTVPHRRNLYGRDA